MNEIGIAFYSQTKLFSSLLASFKHVWSNLKCFLSMGHRLSKWMRPYHSYNKRFALIFFSYNSRQEGMKCLTQLDDLNSLLEDCGKLLSQKTGYGEDVYALGNNFCLIVLF